MEDNFISYLIIELDIYNYGLHEFCDTDNKGWNKQIHTVVHFNKRSYKSRSINTKNNNNNIYVRTFAFFDVRLPTTKV